MRYRYESDNPALDITDLKSLQDWEVFKDLKSVAGVADINGFGGMVKQYQVLVDPEKLQYYNVTLTQLAQALTNGNANVGGGLMPSGEQQLVVRGVGLVQSLDDIRNIAIVANGVGAGSTGVTVGLQSRCASAISPRCSSATPNASARCSSTSTTRRWRASW